MKLPHLRCKFSQYSKGFTLVELIIVISIIGLLSGMAVASISRMQKQIVATEFITDMKIYKDLLMQCATEVGYEHLGASPGQLSSDLAKYIDGRKWSATTPIGGTWDVDSGASGIMLSIGVDGYSSNSQILRMVDRTQDDGDLNTGKLRITSPGKFHFVLLE